MALKFEFHNDKIKMTANIFMFKAFADIWKWDKSPSKQRANGLYRMIFMICDISDENPIKDVSTDKREEAAKYRIYNDRNRKFTAPEYKLLKSGLDTYVLVNTTPEELVLKASDDKADQISSLIETTIPETEVNIVNGVTTYVSNSPLLTKAMSRLSKIRTQRSVLMASIKNEATSEKIRGQKKLSPADRGLIKINKDV